MKSIVKSLRYACTGIGTALPSVSLARQALSQIKLANIRANHIRHHSSPGMPVTCLKRITNTCLKFLCIFVFSIIYAQSAFALCTSSSSVPFTLPSLTMNLNSIPLNAPIGSEQVTSAVDVFTCNSNFSTFYPVSNRYINDYYGTSAGIQINGRTIYTTSVPGIGYAFALEPTNFCSNTIRWAPFTTCIITGSIAFTFNAKFRLQLYKIGPISSTANITIPSRAKGLQLYERYTDNSATIYYMGTTANAFSLTAYTCTLTSTSNSSINLANVYGSSFGNIGTTLNSTPFNITINCPNPVSLNITFTDNNNTSQTGNFLTPSSTSTAKGLGVQLKYNGKVISFGPDSAEPGTTNQIVLNSNLIGTQTFPFTAAYVRTGTVSPGSFTARATFTLSYQ